MFKSFRKIVRIVFELRSLVWGWQGCALRSLVWGWQGCALRSLVWGWQGCGTQSKWTKGNILTRMIGTYKSEMLGNSKVYILREVNA